MTPLAVVYYYFLNLKSINNKILGYLDENSFYIFLLHVSIICNVIPKIFEYLGIYNSILYVFISSILTIIVIMILYKIIDKLL